MIIRQARQEDVLALLKAEQAHGQTEAEYSEGLYDYYINDPSTTVLIALASQNKIIGTIIFDHQHNVIFHLFTIPEMRKKGIGEKLFSSALSILDLSADNVALDVDKDNKDALRLYSKFGFCVNQTICNNPASLSLIRKPFSHLKL